MEIISAKNIVKQYRTGRGIEGVSFSVRKGQCLGVLGSNGSGKTTLTRLIAGLDRIEQGHLRLFDHPTYPQPTKVRRRCGISLDTPAHWETLSGRQNLSFFARQYGLLGTDLKERVETLLSEADLTAQADEPVSAYSFGMCRKLSIIEAMAHDPELLILDEPSAGVDMSFMDRLVQWIRQRCEEGKTTWIADNDADWLGRSATDVFLLSQGRIQAGGSVRELMDSIDARYRITVSLTKPDFQMTPTLDGIGNFQCNGSHISADLSNDSRLPIELFQWITAQGGQIRSMEIRSITLYEALKQCSMQQEAVR